MEILFYCNAKEQKQISYLKVQIKNINILHMWKILWGIFFLWVLDLLDGYAQVENIKI
jgi:hypothetical protein